MSGGMTTAILNDGVSGLKWPLKQHFDRLVGKKLERTKKKKRNSRGNFVLPMKIPQGEELENGDRAAGRWEISSNSLCSKDKITEKRMGKGTL